MRSLSPISLIALGFLHALICTTLVAQPVLLAEPPQASNVEPTPAIPPLPEPYISPPAGNTLGIDSGQFAITNLSETDAPSRGFNFNEFPRSFSEGLTIQNGRWATKIGGYFKADLISDFDAIDSRDSFDPSLIDVGGPDRTSTRFHTKQTRLNLDTRWKSDSGDPIRMLVEVDFFGDGDTLRLRHAYGEFRSFVIGQTWSTFGHRAALPNTLDLVGDVASVGRRQAQFRYTLGSTKEGLSVSAALEDSRINIDETLAPLGRSVAIGPDAIFRTRFSGEDFQIQIASVFRRLGFQPTGTETLSTSGLGLNLTAYADLTESTRLYGGFLLGEGIGSYRDLPDVALATMDSGLALDTKSWYCGVNHHWNRKWQSNVTYSRGGVENTPLQSDASIRELEYFAANVIWQPSKATFVGAEYLWGTRTNKNMLTADANRIQVSVGFILP